MATEHQPAAKGVKEPFVGPRPFGEKDEDIFFGRDQETSEMVSLIISHPVVLLYSQSGAGKTSLLNASLLPFLKRRKLEVLPIARVRGRGDQFAELQNEANIYVYNALDYLSSGRLSPAERAGMSLASFLPSKKTTSKREISPLRVVIFDQFEELFTTHPERFEDRLKFFEEVRDALELDPLLRVVFAMREDFIAELDPYTSILPEKLQTRYRLLRLNEHSARVAIERPVERANQTLPIQYLFEPEAADKVVDNLRTMYVKTSSGQQQVLGPFIEPVHLQVVCRTIWRKLNQARPPLEAVQGTEFRITKDAVEEVGDVHQALSEFYEESLQLAVEAANRDKPDKERKLTEGVLRAWFSRTLITPEGTRGTVFSGRHDKTVGGIPRAAVVELENQRLIRAELRSGEVWYELSHDRFIQPIRNSNEAWLRRQPAAQQKGQELEAKAAEWARLEKGRPYLLNRTELEEANRWMESPEGAGIGYSETLFAYIQASRAAHQQRRVRFLVAGSVALLLLLVAMTGLTGYALEQRSEARRALAIAEEQRSIAKAAEIEARRALVMAYEKSRVAESLAKQLEVKAEVAEAAQKTAEEQKEAAVAARSEAERQQREATVQRDRAREAALLAQRRGLEVAEALEESRKQEVIAHSREIAASAVSMVEADPELSVLLAIEANKIRPTEEAEAALRTSLPSLSNTLAVLRGDNEPLEDARFLTGNRQVITISSDETASVWTVNPYRNILKIDNIVAFSQNDQFLMVSTPGSSGFAKVLEAGSWQEVGRIDFKDKIVSAVVSSDGKVAAIGSGSNTFLYDVGGAQPVKVLAAGGDKLLAGSWPVAFSPDGKLLVTMGVYVNPGDKSTSSYLQLWDTRTGQRIAESNPGQEVGGRVSFSPDGRYLIVGAEDKTQVWDVEVKGITSPAHVLQGQRGEVTDIRFSPDGRRLVTASTNNTAWVWDTATWQSTTVLSGHTNAVSSVAFSPDGQYVVTASADNTARIWEVQTGRTVQTLRGHSGPVTRATFSSDGLSVVTASADGSARLWSREREAGLVVLKGHSAEVYTGSFNQDGSLAVTASADGTARIWDARTGDEIHTLSHPGNYIYCATFSPDGRSVATASMDNTVRIWEVSSGKVLRILHGHTGNVYWVSFSSDGSLLATASLDKTVIVWDFNTGQVVKRLTAQAPIKQAPMKHVAFSPDDKFIAAAVLDGTALVWELETGKLMLTLRAKGDRGMFSVGYSPDGRYIITSGFAGSTGLEGSAQVWDARSGKLESTLVGHKAGLLNATFSRDGRYIVTASRDKTARLWEVGTWKSLAELRGHTDMVESAELSRDNMYIITSSGDSTARIYSRTWFAPLDELLKAASERVTRTLSAEERARYLHETPPP